MINRRQLVAGLKPLAVTGSLILLTACASTTDLVRDCCYSGKAALTRIEKVQFVMPDGHQVPFGDLNSEFQPQTGLFTSAFDFRKVDIARVTFAPLLPVLPRYDANKDGHLEEPEITVMYIREAAIGLGYEVDHLAVDGVRADAVTVARADVGGLVSYIKYRRDSMTLEAQAIFQDLERVGIDLRTQPDFGGDRRVVL